MGWLTGIEGQVKRPPPPRPQEGTSSAASADAQGSQHAVIQRDPLAEELFGDWGTGRVTSTVHSPVVQFASTPSPVEDPLPVGVQAPAAPTSFETPPQEEDMDEAASRGVIRRRVD